MPNPDPNSDLATRATAEAELLRAQAELIKAKRELAIARQEPDPIVAASMAEKAQLDAKKGALESNKGFWDAKKSADLAAAQAAIGSVTGSNLDGSVVVKTDAGKGEATLLASKAIDRAAITVANAISNAVKDKRVVLMPAAEMTQFANYRQFLLQEALIDRIFEKVTTEAGELAKQADQLVKQLPAPQPAAPPAAPLLTTAGVALEAVTKLGSYFMSNYEIGGIGLTPDVEQLIAAVANRLLAKSIKLVLPDRRVPEPSDFSEIVEQIATKVTAADASASDFSGKSQAAKPKSSDAAKIYDEAAAMLRKAITKAEEFISAIGVADTKGVTLLTKIAHEKAICDELKKQDSLALALDVRAMSGGYYTKKNLWTFLGSMPFYAMGGAVVTYSLFDRDGLLNGAGLVPCHGGYAAVNEIPKALQLGR